MKTVVGLYDNFSEAQRVAQALQDGGFSGDEISVVANDASGEYSTMSGDAATSGDNDGAAAGAVGGTVVGGTLGVLAGLGALAIPGIGPVVAAGPLLAGLAGAGVGAATGGLVGALADAGVPDEDAQYYSEGVRNGGALVSVRTDDDRAQRAADIMNNYDASNVEQRDEGYSSTDTSYSTTDTAYTGATTTSSTGFSSTNTDYDRDRVTRTGNDDDVIEVIEEDLRVGKRQVQGGGARLYSRIVSEPVEEQVTLRQERVTVERTPVDRPADASDLDAFQDTSIEMTEMREEAIVQKEARVVEEIRLNKEVEETTQTIRDTVRHTEVDVDQLDTNYRTDYDTNYASSGRDYDSYQPAYRFGSTLANDASYSNREWADIESDARTRWERDYNDSPWDNFKDAIRRGWDEVRGRR